MGITKTIGMTVGVLSLGAAGVFVGGDLLASFNAHADNPAAQTTLRTLATLLGVFSAGFVGYKGMVAPVLFPKNPGPASFAGLIILPFALAGAGVVAGIGGYGGYRAADALVDHAVAKKAEKTRAATVPVPTAR